MNAQMHVPNLSKINKSIIIAGITIFLVSSIAERFIGIAAGNFLSLSVANIFNGAIWSVITYALTPQGLMGALFGSLIIWFIGSELENLWGPKKYLSYISSIIIGGAIIYLLISFMLGKAAYPFIGYSGLGGAMCVSYGVLFPDKMLYLVIFPVKGKYFSMILIAMSLYTGIFSPAGVLAWGQLGMYLSAFLWMFYITKKSQSGAVRKKRNLDKSHLKIVH